MSDTLPILFSAGQNEGIDPRVLPADQHKIVQNIRFRKDGRPQKRPGVQQVASTGLDSGGSLYTTQYVNAIAEWSGAPLLALGGGVRQLVNGAWTQAADAYFGEISHWTPGERQPVARGEMSLPANPSVGSANGVVLYAWDDGTSIYVSVSTPDGAAYISKLLLQTGTAPRVVSSTLYLYILYYAGGTVFAITFDAAALTFSVPNALRTGLTAGQFDAAGRGGEFLLATQTGASTVTAERFSAVAVPTSIASRAFAMTAATTAYLAIAGSATGSVFMAWKEGTIIACCAATNSLGGGIAASTIDNSANNTDVPGLVTSGTSVAFVYFGGEIAGTQQNFVSSRRYTDTGTLGTTRIYPCLRMISKPFNGPAEGTLGSQDCGYFWAHTNENPINSSLDDQRTHYLLQGQPYLSAFPRRQMWTPNLPGLEGRATPVTHLVDVVAMNNGSHVTLLKNALRINAGLPETTGLDSVTFTSIFASKVSATRDTAMAGRVLQISGGVLTEFSGDSEETGFSNPPLIRSVTLAAGVGLSASSTYIYRAVVEYIDRQGRRHRSAASDPFTVTTAGATQDATLTIWGLTAYEKANSPILHIYRTLAGQSTYHRATRTPVSAYGVNTYSDGITDALLIAREFVYTDGGVLDNTPPPPCTFMAYCAGRLWLGGQLDRCVLTASKLLVDGEPTQFSDFDAFNVFLPDKNTGLASIDGTLVAFSRDRIFLVNGEGPDDQGNGSFNPPAALPTDTGCIDWRSVVETSIGVFFQSKRGIFLLPRGFGTPVFIGAAIEDTLALWPVITSATLVAPSDGNEITVRFTATNGNSSLPGVVLVYDIRTGGWSVDYSPSLGNLGMGGMWLDVFVQEKVASGGKFVSLWQDNPGSYDDSTLFIPSVLGTGDIRPFGLAGFGLFKSVLVVGEFRASSIVSVTVKMDGGADDTVTFPVTSADGADGVVYLDVTPRVQKASSISVLVSDSANTATGSAATEGFVVQGIFIEHEMIAKTKPLALARRA